jgi:DNA-binding beta-propeller fold protein YncE
MFRSLAAIATIVLCMLGSAHAIAATPTGSSCDARPQHGRAELSFPLHPFMVLSTRDDCWLLVTLTDDEGKSGGVAVFHRDADGLKQTGQLALPSGGAGAVLTADEKLVAISGGDRVYFVDIAKLLSGGSAPILGQAMLSGDPAALSVALDADEHWLLVSDENRNTVSMIDFARARRDGFASVSVAQEIAVDNGPTVLASSLDRTRAFVPVEVALKKYQQPATCADETSDSRTLVYPSGALLMIDTAANDPDKAVIGRAYVGCSPVRAAVSKDGRTVWVTLRAENRLKAFDTAKFGTDAAKVADVEVGRTPVGLALIHDDALVVVANADRFANDQSSPRTLSVVDVAAALKGLPAVIGQVTVGAFPRDIAKAHRSDVIYVSNFNSKTVSVIDTSKDGWMTPAAAHH